jgi:hypothetical protein
MRFLKINDLKFLTYKNIETETGCLSLKNTIFLYIFIQLFSLYI